MVCRDGLYTNCREQNFQKKQSLGIDRNRPARYFSSWTKPVTDQAMSRLKPDYKPSSERRPLHQAARRQLARMKQPVHRNHYWLGAGLALAFTVMLANVSSQPVSPDSIADFEGGVLQPLELPATGQIARAEGSNEVAGLTRLQLEVKAGDSLAAMFDRHNLSRQDLHAIMELGQDVKRLRMLQPGDKIAVTTDESGGIFSLGMETDESHRLNIHRTGDGFSASAEALPLQRRVRTATGKIETSLYAAGYEAGLSDTLIMNLANIYGWDIDFALDIRRGDEFRIMFEEIYRDGEKIKDGPIIAAEFVNDGRTLKAVRFVEPDGTSAYYAPNGDAMKKTFLRAPLNFLYVSSNFNPNRRHPILKEVRPHNGIDYSAPKGTPVYAAGDGRVIRSSYSKYNGHHVFIQHGEKYVTKYLHFTRRTVSAGQRVKQGQIIGYVGATGLATAAHLHYEFLVNGVHRNPRTVKLPDAEPIDDKYREQFMAMSQPLLRQLEMLDSPDQSRLAAAP